MSSTLSDPYLIVAFWTGLGAMGATLLLAAQVVRLRIGLRREQARNAAAIAKWRPILTAALAGDAPAALPPLADAERLHFLKLWVHLHKSVRGEAGDALNAVAYRLGCDGMARALLRRGNRAERSLAMLILGHLRDAGAWKDLLGQAAATDSATAIHALWALVKIDPAAAADHMTPFFIQSDDWSLSQVVVILQEAKDICAPVLIRALDGLDPARLPRALQLAEALEIQLPTEMLGSLLQHAEAGVVIATLRLANNPAVLPHVRSRLSDPDWRVRVQVAKILGRSGDRTDVDRLRRLLNDPQWWVRYRAAKALVALPFLSRRQLDEFAAETADRFARDMLQHVLAEQEARQ